MSAANRIFVGREFGGIWRDRGQAPLSRRDVVFVAESTEDANSLLRFLLEEEIRGGDSIILFDPHQHLTENVLAVWQEARRRPILLQPDVLITHTVNLLQVGPGYGPVEAADAAAAAVGRFFPSSDPAQFRQLIWAGCYLLAAARQEYTLLDLSRWFSQRGFRNAVVEQARERRTPTDEVSAQRAFGLCNWLDGLDHDARNRRILPSTDHLHWLLFDQPYPCFLVGAAKSTVTLSAVRRRSFVISYLLDAGQSHAVLANNLLAAWLAKALHRARPPWFGHNRTRLYLNGPDWIGSGPDVDLAKTAQRLKMPLRLSLTPDDPWHLAPWSPLLGESDWVVCSPEEPEALPLLGAMAASSRGEAPAQASCRQFANSGHIPLAADLESLDPGQFMVWQRDGSAPQVRSLSDYQLAKDPPDVNSSRDWILNPEAREVRSIAEEILAHNTRLDALYGPHDLSLFHKWWAPFAAVKHP